MYNDRYIYIMIYIYIYICGSNCSSEVVNTMLNSHKPCIADIACPTGGAQGISALVAVWVQGNVYLQTANQIMVQNMIDH